MPVFRDRAHRTDFFNVSGDDPVQILFSRGLGRPAASSAIVSPGLQASGRPDNYQPVESAWNIPGPTAIVDVYAPDENTTGTLVVDGAHVIAASDTPGDNDWFKVTLTAGQTYEFGQYAYAGAGGTPPFETNGAPLADAYLELYDENGVLLSYADGGGPNTPSGLDALLTFQATYTGDYYVNATSFDNDGNGVGDFAGDYEIFARTATGTVYTTEYDISSPLHSIDWGGVRVNREHQAVENPDGMEGPRVTGDPAADPSTVEGNALGFPGKNVIYLYFAGEGDLYFHQDSTIPGQVVIQNPYQYEVQAMLTAANEFSKVADVVFVSNYTLNTTTGLYERDPTIEYKPGPGGVENGVKYAAGVQGDGFDADFFYFSYPGTPGPGISLLGSMNPPDTGDEGVAQFNSADQRWNAQMLQPGGFSFVTLIHEFGHGMGLAHPHDTGGGSSVMPGVNPLTPGDDGGAGTHGLNQGVYTMMSYNDGWESSPYGNAETTNEGYGWLGSLMALDIAVIQDKYGVNEDWATGNDTYVLKDVNEWGVYIDSATGQPAEHDATNADTTRDGYYVGESTRYSSIWDADGVDQIVYSGARNTNIDLRAATLQYETGGGGWMSYATGIYGGFTIANGVTIENATSGSGNDVLIGNLVANNLFAGGGNDFLDGRAGADQMSGQAGNDVYVVDNGNDRVFENAGEGNDIVYSEVSYALGGGTSVELLAARDNSLTTALALVGNELANTVLGNGGANFIDGGAGVDILAGYGGNDVYAVDNAADQVFDGAGGGNDIVYASASYALGAGQAVETLAARDISLTTALALIGNELANTVLGNSGANFIDGNGGADVLAGYGGDDIYAVDNAADQVFEGAGGGNDIVYTSASYTLGAGQAVETLAARDNSLTTALALTGNALANTIFGNNGANVIDGGAGADALAGHGGADTFAFTTALGGGNVDTIADFVAGTDKIALDDAVFTAIGGLGALNANAFVTGSAAADANDRIIYNSATGQLFYDADGNGAGAAIQFATIGTGLTLAASDFMVI